MAIPTNPGSSEAADGPAVDAPEAPGRAAPTLRERLDRAVAQLRTPTTGSEVEPVSPHVAPVEPAVEVVAATPRSRWWSAAQVVAAVLVGLAGSLVLAGTAPVWFLAPVSWRLTVPGLLSPGDALYSAVTFVTGVLLMCLGWVMLVGYQRRRQGSERSRLAWVAVAAAIWAVPMLLGPVQLSTDAYSYSAQAALADLGLDPTAVGPEALPNHSTNEYWRAADPIWRDAAAPYGPVAIGLGKVVISLAGYDVATTVYGFKLLALGGVVMAGVGVFLIARRRRVSAPLALALAIANPVVLIHLVGGAHNDALMMGLLVLGMAAFERSRKVLAVVIVALALSVKLPAVIALAFIAWNWTPADASWKRKLRDGALVGAITASVVGALCLLVGIGVGWIVALQNTGKIYSTFAVFTKLGFLTADLLHAVGIGVDPMTVVAVVRLLGLAVAAATILVLMVKSPKIGVTKAVGLSLLVFVLCSPVVWPWYLPAAFALLAASGLRTYRPSLIVLVVSASLLVWPTSVSSVSALTPYQHWLGFGVALLIAVACVVAQYLSTRFERYRSEHGHRPLLTGAAGEDPPAPDPVPSPLVAAAR